MNANTLAENLWHQILTLPDNDRHWLRDKLNIYEKEREDEENLTPYTMEELHERIRCSEEDFEAGDIVIVPGVRKGVERGDRTFAAKLVRGGVSRDITLKLDALTPDEKEIILSGSLINYYKRG